ncbi:MAG TPA: hypothetical protein VIK72_18870 [Clostridiaceae bacterium]
MHNHKCNKLVQFRKNGFYERYFSSSCFDGKIVIRRYICPLCGHTISVMPSFCMPKYINALENIFEYICSVFHRYGTIKECLEELNMNSGMNISRQLLYHYRKRFKENLTFIQAGIRRLNPEAEMPDIQLESNKKAREVLDIVKNWPWQINSFSQQFFEKNTKTFLTKQFNLL